MASYDFFSYNLKASYTLTVLFFNKATIKFVKYLRKDYSKNNENIALTDENLGYEI